MTRSTKQNASRRKKKIKANRKASARIEQNSEPKEASLQSSRTIRAPIAHRTVSLKESGVPGSQKELLLIVKDNITAIFALREFVQRSHGDVSPSNMQWYRTSNSDGTDPRTVGVLIDLDIPPSDRDERPEPPPDRASSLPALLASLKEQQRLLENRLAQMKPDQETNPT